MLKLLLTATAPVASFAIACAIAAPASSQDASANPYWGGWYVGANVGGSWADTKLRTTVTTANPLGALASADAAAISAASHDTSNKAGFTGGAQAGYNYVYDNQWLFGGEVDWEGIDIRSASNRAVPSTVVPGAVYNLSQEVSAGWLATLRPRVGYIYNNNLLLYGTIGFAWADLKYQASLSTNTNLPPISAESNTTKTGWAGGVGLGYAFNPHWSMRGEWLYTDLGHANTAAVSGTYATVKPDDNVAANLVRVGLDYRF